LGTAENRRYVSKLTIRSALHPEEKIGPWSLAFAKSYGSTSAQR